VNVIKGYFVLFSMQTTKTILLRVWIIRLF